MDTSGFYKLEDGRLLHGPNFVLNADYELRRAAKDSQQYPVEGWNWFDDIESAKEHFGVVDEPSPGVVDEPSPEDPILPGHRLRRPAIG